MTRDEAFGKLLHTSIVDRTGFIDGLAALGLLKLDEPKPPPLVTAPDNDPYDQWITIMGPSMSYPAFVPIKSTIKALQKRGYIIGGLVTEIP